MPMFRIRAKYKYQMVVMRSAKITKAQRMPYIFRVCQIICSANTLRNAQSSTDMPLFRSLVCDKCHNVIFRTKCECERVCKSAMLILTPNGIAGNCAERFWGISAWIIHQRKDIELYAWDAVEYFSRSHASCAGERVAEREREEAVGFPNDSHAIGNFICILFYNCKISSQSQTKN